MLNNNFNIRFKKILNDLKRRPEDAAKDLGVTKKTIDNILNGKKNLSFKLIKKAVSVWPVNFSEFFEIIDDTKNGFKIFKNAEANSTKRKMYRGGEAYYLYKDSVMSKISSFRPEWIQQLKIVNNSNPNNSNVKFNNGHFLHQFTYFIGPVNFYYMSNGKKKVAQMNTGDSMYISPYIPHTFTTRKNSEKKLGHILALTYSDKISTETLNELNAIGYDLIKRSKLNLKNKIYSFKTVLNYFLKNSSMSIEVFNKKIGINLKKILSKKEIPDQKVIKKIAGLLGINERDLTPPVIESEVKIQKYDKNKKWYYPSNTQKRYLFVELTSLSQIPTSKAFELTILSDKENSTLFEVPTHQYIYNIGSEKIFIKFENKILETFNPGDSIYLKPNLKHKFIGRGKILIFRIGGQISSDTLFHISWLSDANLRRLLKDDKQWFN
jgi:transcriptional regulator with XRE-family HTH domain